MNLRSVCQVGADSIFMHYFKFVTPTCDHLYWINCREMKGYGSNQSELRVVVTFPTAEPMTLGLLHICEHACNMTHRQRIEQLTLNISTWQMK